MNSVVAFRRNNNLEAYLIEGKVMLGQNLGQDSEEKQRILYKVHGELGSQFIMNIGEKVNATEFECENWREYTRNKGKNFVFSEAFWNFPRFGEISLGINKETNNYTLLEHLDDIFTQHAFYDSQNPNTHVGEIKIYKPGNELKDFKHFYFESKEFLTGNKALEYFEKIKSSRFK